MKRDFDFVLFLIGIGLAVGAIGLIFFIYSHLYTAVMASDLPEWLKHMIVR